MADPILVGVALDRDGDPIALGLALARIAGMRLALVHAYQYEPGTVPPPEHEALRDESRAELERLAAALPEDVDVTLHSCAGGSPVDALRAAAETLHPAAIVVGATRRGVDGQVPPGCVGERLLYRAPCPVAIAPHGCTAKRLSKIGVAFDGSPEAHDALEAAIELAHATGGDVSTYTVTEPVDAAAIVPAELDLLVCGSRGFGPLRAAPLGSVATALAQAASCPLLVIPRRARARLGAEPPALAQRAR